MAGGMHNDRSQAKLIPAQFNIIDIFKVNISGIFSLNYGEHVISDPVSNTAPFTFSFP